jgi:hypothetical protein
MRQRAVLGKTGLKSPKSANPAIKVLWSSEQEQATG